MNEKKLYKISEDIFNYYEEIGDEKIVDNLVDTIEETLKGILEDEVIENLKNSVDYCLLKNEDDKEEFIEENKFSAFIDLINEKGFTNKIYNNVINMFNKVGYDCYDGEFYPWEGRFISLNFGSVVFIRRNYDVKISTNDLFELVEIEMNEGSHDDNIEDYKTELDFYLSSVLSESYVDCYLHEQFYDLCDDDLINIAKSVELEIKERVKKILS